MDEGKEYRQSTPPCGAEQCALAASASPEVTSGGLRYLKCGACGALRLPADELKATEVEPDGGGGGAMRLLFRLRRQWLGATLPQLDRPDAALLDVGCGDGQFLSYLQSEGARNVIGVEPSPARRRNAAARGVPVVAALADLGPRRFDAIFLWHVLEHVDAPVDLLRELAARLSADGALIVSIPNQAGWQTRCFGRYSTYLDYGRHLWYWGPELVDLLRRELPAMAVRPLGGRNLEYEIFGWVDTLASRLASRVNFIHSRLKKRVGSVPERAAAAGLATLLLPLAGLLALLVPSAAASTLTVVIEPRHPRSDGAAPRPLRS